MHKANGAAMNSSFANARLGIQLAQQGRRQEALTYLRLAVQTEQPNVDVWLWLAHVTPLREEYQHCVEQALQLDPYHNTARQMHAMLGGNDIQQNTTQYQSRVTNPNHNTQGIAVDDNLIRKMQRQRSSRQYRRLGLMLVLLMGLIAAAVAIGTTFRDELAGNDADNNTQNTLSVAVVPQNREFDVIFSMTVPESWLLADIQSEAWQAAKANISDLPAVQSIWETLEVDLAMVRINPANDDVEPHVAIVETDVAQFADSSGQPLRLELVRLGAVYASMDDASCDGIRQLAEEQQNTISESTDDAPSPIIENRVVTQTSNRCVYFVHYFGRSALSEQEEHIYVIYVPIPDQQLLAEWHLTIVDNLHADYRPDISELLTTLTAN